MSDPFRPTPREEVMQQIIAEQSRLLLHAAEMLKANAEHHEGLAALNRATENDCRRFAHDPTLHFVPATAKK